MNDRLKEAFDQVHAEEELKNKTKEFLIQQTNGYIKDSKQRNTFPYRRVLAAMACFVFLFLGAGGYQLYFIPTSSITIEINPSVELGINRFDKVISAKGNNDDGRELLASLDIKYANYADALNKILMNEKVAACLEQNEIMSISVTGADAGRNRKILRGVEACTNKNKNIHCFEGRGKEAHNGNGSGNGSRSGSGHGNGNGNGHGNGHGKSHGKGKHQ